MRRERGGYTHLAEHDADGGREAKGDTAEAEDVAEARSGLQQQRELGHATVRKTRRRHTTQQRPHGGGGGESTCLPSAPMAPMQQTPDASATSDEDAVLPVLYGHTAEMSARAKAAPG